MPRIIKKKERKIRAYGLTDENGKRFISLFGSDTLWISEKLATLRPFKGNKYLKVVEVQITFKNK